MLVELMKHKVSRLFPGVALTVDTHLNEGVLHLHYHLSGQTADILFPVTAGENPKQTEGLWEHTCFEAFLGIEGQSEYCEFNFSPAGDWAAYAFSDYRERNVWSNSPKPGIALTHDNSGINLKATVPLMGLPKEFSGQSLLLGLSAVLEANSLSKSWWAIEHARPAPDFHYQCGWIPVESLPSKP